jgi:hypothetical protein
LKKFLRRWHFQMLDHQVPCHILLPSRRSSSSMLPSSTYSAITNRPLRTGRLPIQQSVVANPGHATKVLHSILQILTGYYPVLFSTRYFHRSLP